MPGGRHGATPSIRETKFSISKIFCKDLTWVWTDIETPDAVEHKMIKVSNTPNDTNGHELIQALTSWPIHAPGALPRLLANGGTQWWSNWRSRYPWCHDHQHQFLWLNGFWCWKNVLLWFWLQWKFTVYPSLACCGSLRKSAKPSKKKPSFRLQMALLHLLQNLQSYGPRSSILEGAQGGIETDHIRLLGKRTGINASAGKPTCLITTFTVCTAMYS